MDISDVYAYIGSDMDRVEKALIDNLSSNAELIPVVGEHIAASGGKRFRPAVLILCARTLGCRNRRAIDLACVSEYMHTASLLHDDVVDGSNIRRGRPSANTLFGNKISILVGDFLFARASEIMVRDGDMDVLEIFSRTLVHLSEGEVLQLTRSCSPEINEEEYLNIVFNKTASLISASSETGAVIAGVDRKARKSMYDYGKKAGVAFQIMDDILDYRGYAEKTGKPRGQDLVEGKVTLPLIYALSVSKARERKEIVRLLKGEKNKEVVEKIIHFVVDKKGIEYSLNRAGSYVDEAIKCLHQVKDGKAKRALISLTKYIVGRSM